MENHRMPSSSVDHVVDVHLFLWLQIAKYDSYMLVALVREHGKEGRMRRRR